MILGIYFSPPNSCDIHMYICIDIIKCVTETLRTGFKSKIIKIIDDMKLSIHHPASTLESHNTAIYHIIVSINAICSLDLKVSGKFSCYVLCAKSPHNWAFPWNFSAPWFYLIRYTNLEFQITFQFSWVQNLI